MDVFVDFPELEKMSYDRGLSEPQPEHVSLAGMFNRSRWRQDRPLSDGDIWAAYLPANNSFPYRNITDHSCLKVYHKDPAQAFSHGPRPANGDARVSTSLLSQQLRGDEYIWCNKKSQFRLQFFNSHPVCSFRKECPPASC